MTRAPGFWTDVLQASERLLETVVLYDDTPCLVEGVSLEEDGGVRLNVCLINEGMTKTRKKTNSPLFHNFRKLPKTGWMNYADEGNLAVFHERVTKSTRRHGLCNENTHVFTPGGEGDLKKSGTPFIDLAFDSGYRDMQRGAFPTLTTSLQNIQNKHAIAVSRKFCVYRSGTGFRGLYRNKDKIGLFTGINSLLLSPETSHYREEILDDSVFPTGFILTEF